MVCVVQDSTTFNSQSTYVLPYTHPSGKTLHIYMGDRFAGVPSCFR